MSALHSKLNPEQTAGGTEKSKRFHVKVKLASYKKNIRKYVRLVSLGRQVIVVNEEGKVLRTLGRRQPPEGSEARARALVAKHHKEVAKYVRDHDLVKS